MKSIFWIFICLSLLSCDTNTYVTDIHIGGDSINAEVQRVIDSVPPFKSIPSNFETDHLLLPEGFTYTVLFSEFDSVTRADQKIFPAKGNHDLTVFIPDKINPNTKGWLYISHETKYKDDGLGDGGGATMFEIEFKHKKWQVISDFNHIDFSGVGFTNRNCGGSLTPNGTIFTCEETWSHNTEYLYQFGQGQRDTSWVNGRPAWQNMGYIVEVDPITRKVIKKHYQMGKYVHEDVHCTADGKAVYLTDDMNPGIFYKFIPDTAYNYNFGHLFAYKQSSDGISGEWLEIPNDTNSWINVSEIALKKGATMFIRHEWIEEIDGKLYICETGQDHYNLTQSYEKGGQFSNYALANLRKTDIGEDFDDPYGRILEFDPIKNRMSVYLEGGLRRDSLGCFSNPDCNTSIKIGNKTYLVLSEDIIGMDRDRSGNQPNSYCNELYFLDMSIENPDVDDLMRFAVAPKNSETTGVVFTPDGKHMIMNIQHPDRSNPAPFNRSCTIIISGF